MLDNTHRELTAIYSPLRITYGLVPIAAGLDKFFNVLTEWQSYLPEAVSSLLPFSATGFMHLVGIIEIVAGIAVLTRFTRLAAWVVAAWLSVIAVNLIWAGHLDIAVRDLVMALGAYCLARLAALRDESPALWPASLEGVGHVEAH